MRTTSPPSRQTERGQVGPAGRIPGHVGDLSVQHAILIEVDLTRQRADENDAQGEEPGERDPDCGVFLQPTPFVQELHHHGRQDAERAGAEQHGRGGSAAGDEEGDDDPRQHRVTDGVAEHRHAAQHQEATDERAGHGGQGAREDDPSARRQQLRHRRGSSSSAREAGA
jgi:hypothetical protein